MKVATHTVSADAGRGGPDAEPRSWWSALLGVLAHWRDWRIPVKLAAVTLVPVVFAVVLGTMQISDQVDEANEYRRVDRLVAVDEKLRDLIRAVQDERTTAGALLAARASDTVAQLADERDATDDARDEFLRVAGRVTLQQEAGAARYEEALTWLTELSDVRRQVAVPGYDAGSGIGRYSAIIDALLRFDRTISAEVLDSSLASAAAALHDLEEIKEEISYQRVIIAVGIQRGHLTGPEIEALVASLGRQSDRLADFYSVAGETRSQLYDDVVSGTGVASRNNVVAAVVANAPGEAVLVTARDWADGSTLTANRVTDVIGVLGADLRARSAALQDAASDGAGVAAVILLVALVVAGAVMAVVGRHLLGSLAALRNGALDVARRALPAAVIRIRERGERPEGIADLPPMPVTSRDEVGQVARAFDAVQRQALRLATEQAGLRAKYSSVFVNLSRRSQGLVQRQLQLLERLERDEEDAEQLATLFQLDHLATRMRRNNENLMVLSGGEVVRRSQRPAALADLLRAAVSEIEQYQRVTLPPPPSVEVVGYAVGDLVRLVAELLDNATAFSAPDTRVTVASHVEDNGSLRVTVLDEGIGMSHVELAEANTKLADSGAVDVSTSRRMGLFVVGRLAGRHGIDVRLTSAHDGTGVRATVTVPPDLLRQPDGAQVREPRRPKPATGTSLLVPFALNGQVNGTGHNGTNGHDSTHANGVIRSGLTPSALPRRAEWPTAEEVADHEAGYPAAPNSGHAPLPRRSPGGTVPGPRHSWGEPVRGLFTPARGQEPTDASWWSDQGAAEHTTPIFDEMVSAWFRAFVEPSTRHRITTTNLPSANLPVANLSANIPTPEHQPPGLDGAHGRGEAWNFTADSGFDAARAASGAEPSDFTSGGLPRRSPRQHLVPGSAAPGATAEPPRHGREADDLRSRLSEYRQGVRKARGHRHGVDSPSTPNAAPVTPSRRSRPDPMADTVRMDLPAGDWHFAADHGWRTANEVSMATPADYTSGGLPRRSPRQNLVPGSVSLSGNGHGGGNAGGNGGGNGAVAGSGYGGRPREGRAEAMRGRLGRFQKGLSRGRRSLVERRTANGGNDHKQQQESE